MGSPHIRLGEYTTLRFERRCESSCFQDVHVSFRDSVDQLLPESSFFNHQTVLTFGQGVLRFGRFEILDRDDAGGKIRGLDVVRGRL